MLLFLSDLLFIFGKSVAEAHRILFPLLFGTTTLIVLSHVNLALLLFELG